RWRLLTALQSPGMRVKPGQWQGTGIPFRSECAQRLSRYAGQEFLPVLFLPCLHDRYCVVLFTNASAILCSYTGHCHDTKLMRRRMPNRLETTPDRLSDHSFGIIFRSRAAVAIAKSPVMIDHTAMNDSRMSLICAVYRVRFSSLPLPDGRMIHHRAGHAQAS